MNCSDLKIRDLLFSALCVVGCAEKDPSTDSSEDSTATGADDSTGGASDLETSCRARCERDLECHPDLALPVDDCTEICLQDGASAAGACVDAMVALNTCIASQACDDTEGCDAAEADVDAACGSDT